MRTQYQNRTSKTAYNPHVAAAAQVRVKAEVEVKVDVPRFRVVKPYEGFRLNQVVYQYQGPTFGIEGPGEVPVTVTPNRGPFVGLTPDYLERVMA
jgi:hypothetical protein